MKRLEVRAKARATIRVEVPVTPQEILVNDGSVPETDMTNNGFKLESSSYAEVVGSWGCSEGSRISLERTVEGRLAAVLTFVSIEEEGLGLYPVSSEPQAPLPARSI